MGRDRPTAVLGRHFFTSLFDFGFLSDAGSESFKRALLGGAAVACALGLLLVRIFLGKYANLSAGPIDRYIGAATMDHAFLIALQMWIVATAVTLVGHSLFPDERDFRILTAQPVARAEIFGAKLAALLRFAALFAAGAYAALLPLFALSLLGPPGSGGILPWFAAYSAAAVAGNAFAALAVVALHGVVVLVVPGNQLGVISAAVRSGLVCVLVLSLPMIARLPAGAAAWTAGDWWIAWVPPAWFAGLERWLAGDAARSTLALRALWAIGVASAVATASYLVLYRRFDRVILRPSARPAASSASRSGLAGRRPSERLAVLAFVRATFSRSVLHQGIGLSVMAAGGGLVVNGLFASDPRELLLWAPFPLMVLGAPAVRLALAVPIEPRANWIFRITEDGATHADVIGAGVRTVFVLGIALPIALVVPFQAVWFGWHTVVLAGMESLIGWLLVEWLMRDWRKIPFTCAYVPGKGFMPQLFVRSVGAFLVFTTGGAGLVALSLVEPAAALGMSCVIAGGAAALSRRRRRQATLTDLAFEDDLPMEVNPLRLHAD